MTAITHPLDEMRAYSLTAGLGGLAVAGATSPAAVNGAWWYAGAVNAKPSYTNGTYLLAWSTANSRWQLTDLAATPILLFRRTGAGVAGTYTAVSPGTGAVIVTLDPVWLREHDGTGAQLVLTAFRIQSDEDAETGFRRFAVQHAYYLPSTNPATRYAVLDVLEHRAFATWEYYRALSGMTNAATGLALASWTARTVQADLLGVVDALPITGGLLYKAVTEIHLIDLYP